MVFQANQCRRNGDLNNCSIPFVEGLQPARETGLFQQILHDLVILHGNRFTRDELEIPAYVRYKRERYEDDN